MLENFGVPAYLVKILVNKNIEKLGDCKINFFILYFDKKIIL